MDSSLQETLAQIQHATAGISADQLAWHPEGKWSSAEILEHLTLAFSGTVKGMQRALGGNGNEVKSRTWRHRLSAFIVVDLGYLPSGRQAPKMTVPTGATAANPVEMIVKALTEMDAALTEVESIQGKRARLVHPIIGPLTVAQWRKFHLVHTRHHMKQIGRLRQLAS